MTTHLRLTAIALSISAALAGVGGSVVTLSSCNSEDQTFQRWSYTTGKNLEIVNDLNPLWGTIWCLSTGNGINALPSQENGTVFTSPCGQGLAINLTPDVPETTLTLADGSNLCVTVAPPGALNGVILQLSPCRSINSQLFKFSTSSGTLIHASSGLCVDSGSRYRGCEPGSPGIGLPFCDSSLPVDSRVSDLISRLSFDEKVSMLATPSGGSPGLGVSPIQWWQESLHGVANNVGVAFDAPTSSSTSFPQPILSSCSFNRSLWLATGNAISDEVRAFSNVGHSGLTLWAPNINIGRDPRWGRIQECPGEDPFLSGSYAENYVRGMQEGNDPRYLKTSSTCKHFAAYSLENWEGMDRYHFNAIVTDDDLVDVYLPAFQSCVEKGRASAIMCSYNSVNGIPSCANSFLMNTIAREEWLFEGYLTSDCGAVSNIPQTHNYTNSSIATFQVTLPSGMDIGCDMMLVQAGVARQAVDSGAITELDINTAISHLLSVRMRLGEFDDPSQQPYTKIGLDAICSSDHISLARDSARQSLVLLTNPQKILPLNASLVRSVAVVGPFANSSRGINGASGYAGVPCGNSATTIADAFESAGFLTQVAIGCNVSCPSTSGFAEATAIALSADITIVVVGLDETIENEGRDRTYITLPGNQEQLIIDVCKVSRGPCIVAIMSGGAVDIQNAIPQISGGIFYAGFMGGSGAPAFVDTVFGVSAPAGRLTQTFYQASFVNEVSMFEMNMRPGFSAFTPGSSPGRTYQFYTGKPVWPFGFGLSYTTWLVSVTGPSKVSLKSSTLYIKEHDAHGSLYAPLSSPRVATYTVNVTNTGDIDSDYVVLGFLIPPGAGAGGIPLQTLFGFERIRVQSGETVTVWLGLGARELTRVVKNSQTNKYERIPHEGIWSVRIGSTLEKEGETASVSFSATL
jgi:beta-glucosidase-like glycosyl hydrolase